MKPKAQTEKQFQAAVVEYAKLCGWLVYHPYDSRRSTAGFKDLTMVRNGVLVMAELKTDIGRLTSAQMEWHNLLLDVERKAPSAVTVKVWRPSDWPDIEATLRG